MTTVFEKLVEIYQDELMPGETFEDFIVRRIKEEDIKANVPDPVYTLLSRETFYLQNKMKHIEEAVLTTNTLVGDANKLAQSTAKLVGDVNSAIHQEIGFLRGEISGMKKLLASLQCDVVKALGALCKAVTNLVKSTK